MDQGTGAAHVLLMSLLIIFALPIMSSAETGRNIGPLSRHASRYDIRHRLQPERNQPIVAGQRAQLEQLGRQVRGLQTRFHPHTARPHHLFSLSQHLTGPSAENPIRIAQHFLQAQRNLFRIPQSALNDLRMVKHDRSRHSGIDHLVFKQFAHGLEVFQGQLKVNVDAKGQLLSVNGHYVPDIAPPSRPALSAAQAVEIAAASMGLTSDFTPTLKAKTVSLDQASTFYRGPFSEEITAKLILFPASDRVRLAWKTRLHLAAQILWYDTLVDAHTGELLWRSNLYRTDAPRGLIFETHPDSGSRLEVSFRGDSLASPETWLTPPPNTTTQGNNVVTIPAAQDSDQHFDFVFTNAYEAEAISAFDLSMQTLRFTPNTDGAYDYERLEPRFEVDLGTDVTGGLMGLGAPIPMPDPNDGWIDLQLGFTFPFFYPAASSSTRMGLSPLAWPTRQALLHRGRPWPSAYRASRPCGTISNRARSTSQIIRVFFSNVRTAAW